MSFTVEYESPEYVAEELNTAGINIFFVDEVVGYFGVNSASWNTYRDKFEEVKTCVNSVSR